MMNRKIREAGINPFLAYLLLFLFFIVLSEYIFQKTEYARFLMMFTSLSFAYKLSEKKRSDFLLSTFGDVLKRYIRIIENTMLSIPFIGILLYKSFYTEAAVLYLFSSILALFVFKSNFNYSFPTPFSKRPFEFSVGFRKTFLIFPIAYTLSIIAIIVGNLNLGIFSMMLIFLTALSYYTEAEQDFYVWIHSDSIRVFLKNKLLIATRNILLLVAPILVSLLFFYPSEYKLILIFLSIGILFLLSVILAKYSAYPGEMNFPEGIILTSSLFFPPMLLAIIPFFYKKSVNKLKAILHDKN